MSDFFEIDFLDVETDKSGDAIALRYELNGVRRIHVVDGGFLETGDSLVEHINKYYGYPQRIDHVVATHADQDHACGLRAVLKSFQVGALWMNRPWLYAEELLDRFANFTTVTGLENALREAYPNLVELEEIAEERGIPIYEAFQDARIGEFVVLAPNRELFLDLVVNSDRTPDSIEEAQKSFTERALGTLLKVAARAVTFVRSAWGVEIFPPDDTSAENNMSVVQYANLCGKRIVLTADSGRAGLSDAADFAPMVGLMLPGVDRIQVPHHGSRHNVTSELLDRWLGPRLQSQQVNFSSFVSSAKKDTDHPRKSVVRAFMHRGGSVTATEGRTIQTQVNAPARAGWGPATPETYPQDQEEA